MCLPRCFWPQFTFTFHPTVTVLLTCYIKTYIDVLENVRYTVSEVVAMYNTNVTKARAELYKLIEMAIEDNEIININTKKGNAVIVSEADYNALIETLYLSTNQEIRKSIIDGLHTPPEECVSEDEVEW